MTTNPPRVGTRSELYNEISVKYRWDFTSYLLATDVNPEKSARELDDYSLMALLNQLGDKTLPYDMQTSAPRFYWGSRWIAEALREYKYRLGVWDARSREIVEHMQRCQLAWYPDIERSLEGRRVSFSRRYGYPPILHHARVGSSSLWNLKLGGSASVLSHKRYRLIPGLTWHTRNAPTWYAESSDYLTELLDGYCKNYNIQIVE